MKDGFQMSTLMKVTDGAKAGNGITITRGAAEKWQLAYWTSAADYNSHKTNPKMMSGTSLSLKDGAYFSDLSVKCICNKEVFLQNATSAGFLYPG